jgi:two-component system, NtrC family, sensor kinase
MKVMSTEQYNSILVVDDTPNNIRVLLEVLQQANLKVSVVKSGEMALEKLPVILPDLVLLDVMMPGIDGFETCRLLKQDQMAKDIPIIFMTALADTVDKVKGFQLGAVDYVTKPIQIDEVLARVNAHLGLRRAQLLLMHEVTERRKAEEQLQQTLQTLQKTQTQLIQTEKMSSLGQLVAGIAHEINNPINFIYGNLKHANGYTQDLLNLLKIYEQTCPTPNSELQAELEEIDLEFLATDLPKLMDSMQVGAERIRQIVLSLRVFSRLDESDRKAVDIHQGIDSALVILGKRLKLKSDGTKIEIVKNYGDLPMVECYAGQMNQVFMNILMNAIDELSEAVAHHKIDHPCITITTQVENNQWVKIHIADNGSGISPEIQPKLFDPFFTTKRVGQGIGMGLAISYQIVSDKHSGTLQCVSIPGEGAEFIITIPLKQC